MKNASLLLTAVLVLGASLPGAAGAQPILPAGAMTRAAFVQLVLEEKGVSARGDGRCFSDVAEQSFASAVCSARRRGYVTGDPSGEFRPYAHVTFAEAAAVIVRAEGVTVPRDVVWYRPYVEMMGEWDAVPRSVGNIFQGVTREQAREMIRAAEDRGEDGHYDDGDELGLHVTSSDDTPRPGDFVTFRIRLENLTHDDLDDVDVLAELDDRMEYVSATEDGDRSGDEVEWEGLEVEDDETLTLLLNVEIDDDADDGDALTLRVEAEGESASRTVRVEDDDDDDDDDEPELERLSVYGSPDPVRPGGVIGYVIELENGDDDEVDAVVRAFLPDGVRFVSAEDDGRKSGDMVLWDGVELDEDEEEQLRFKVIVAEDALDGDRVVMRVEAAGESDEEVTEVEDSWLSGDEDVRVSVSDSPDPVAPGGQITYRLRIENREGGDIRVDARAFLDADVTFLSASDAGRLENGDEVRWNDVRVEADETRELLLTAKVAPGAVRGGTLYLLFEAGDDRDAESTRVD